MSETVLLVISTVLIGLTWLMGQRDRRSLERQLEREREERSELLNRLMSKSYGEYAAFVHDEPDPEAAPQPEPRMIYDDTGMIGVEVEDESP